MFGSEVLDVAIGIVFVFLLVSLFASAIREGLEGWLKTRATHLEAGIRELLQDPSGTGLTKDLFDHPLIYSLYAGTYSPQTAGWWPAALTRGRNLPSYIPSRNFAVALLDLAARGPVGGVAGNLPTSRSVTLQTVRANLKLIQNPPVQRALLTALDSAGGDLQKAQANVEAWYDSTMDRVSGWYKRSTQWFLLTIGLAIAVGMNVNAISIANYLYGNKSARDVVVATAQSAGKDPNYLNQTYPLIQKDLGLLNLPIGGNGRRHDLKVDPWTTLGGWLLTAIATSFGAPFWFDLLNKFMVIRSTVKPHQKSPEESSEDGQSRATAPNALALPAQGAFSAMAAQPDGGSFAGPNAVDMADGCGLEVAVPTPDEALPLAEGGMS